MKLLWLTAPEIVRRFAELQGGRAWVEDAPGGGAAFKVTLPCGDGATDH